MKRCDICQSDAETNTISDEFRAADAKDICDPCLREMNALLTKINVAVAEVRTSARKRGWRSWFKSKKDAPRV
jgi:hypothetical protein